jgi:hypothetical protein
MRSFTEMRHWRIGLLATSLFILTACEEPNAIPGAAPHESHAAVVSAAQLAHIEQILGHLHRETVRYKNFDVAYNAGYNAKITGCMESAAGGMGYHWGDLTLFDGKVEALKPEVLLYEPQANGKLELVAVEYIVPFSAWTEPNPPQLAGVSFHANNVFGVWALHAWIWKQNPSGKLSDWNPRVSCKYAN